MLLHSVTFHDHTIPEKPKTVNADIEILRDGEPSLHRNH